MRWLRQRGAQPGISEHHLVDTWQVVSLLLKAQGDLAAA